MTDDNNSRVLEPPQNPNPNPNFIPFPYTPHPDTPNHVVYNPTPLQTYHPPTPAATITEPDTSHGKLVITLPQLLPAPQGITLPEVATQLNENGNVSKPSKKAKVVQSQWCDVCNISCNSKDVFDIHILGKKHKKNLEKLNTPITVIPAPVVASTSTPPTISNVHPVDEPLIGPQENPVKVSSSKNALKSKKKKLAATEDMESKRRKLLGGGAAAESVRTCTYCNVVCNSDTVFNYHMAGQKHAATMKKYAAAMTGIAFVAGAS